MGARCVAVAYSGGRDSTALLHATMRAGAALGVDVVGLHVHHGLHAEADAWLAWCRRTCRRWGVRFGATRLDGRPAAGCSVEAWARGERYRALAAMAREHGASLVLLAHHRRDQAETFMLQALRGGGVAGLAAMAPRFERDGIVWARPWLRTPREAIDAYARRHRLGFVDDTSNADPRFARSRLRLDVWPALTRAFPHGEAALADAATWAAQASDLLSEVAASDLARLGDGDALDVSAWLASSAARRRNALLAWLRGAGLESAALIERLMIELPASRTAVWPAGAGVELRLYRGALRVDRGALPRTNAAIETDTLHVVGPGRYAVPGWCGRLVVRSVDRDGVGRVVLAALRAVPRRGAETFQFAPRSTPRSLKKQYQARAVPAWQRDGPLLYAGERLVFVPGLGIDARALAPAAQAQFDLCWERDPSG